MGGILSLALFARIRGWERRGLGKRATDLEHEQADKLQVTILRSMEALSVACYLIPARARFGRSGVVLRTA